MHSSCTCAQAASSGINRGEPMLPQKQYVLQRTLFFIVTTYRYIYLFRRVAVCSIHLIQQDMSKAGEQCLGVARHGGVYMWQSVSY